MHLGSQQAIGVVWCGLVGGIVCKRWEIEGYGGMEVVGVQGGFEKKKWGWFDLCGQMAMMYGEPNPTGMKLNLFRTGLGPTCRRLN